MTQKVDVNANVAVEKVGVMSVFTAIYDTQQKYGQENVSLGSAHSTKLNQLNIVFSEAIVYKVEQFDSRNLEFCKYLNIRNSLFNRIGT